MSTTQPLLASESGQAIQKNEELENPVSGNTPDPVKDDPEELTFFAWLSKWSEDGAGLFVAFGLFIFTLGLSLNKQNLEDYATRKQWAIGLIATGYITITVANYLRKEPQALESYGAIILVGVAAQSIGDYDILKNAGLSASFWAIILGILLRAFGLVNSQPVVSGEFFIKVGITMMAVDFSSLVDVGLPGLAVAWVDTIIVLCVGTLICMYLFKLPQTDSIIISGATTICGSSAATAINSAIMPVNEKNPVCKTIIALMGMLNTPLMPLMPLLRTAGNVNPVVVGAWIGGAIDSTGQVVGSASLGGDAVLEAATIIKVAQNILIGPICLVLTMYFQKSYSLSILLDKFPLFVIGFFITSLIVNVIKWSGEFDSNVCDLTISNAWFLSEWVNLVGFARIGLSIDIMSFVKNSQNHSVLSAYLLIQSIDLATTLGWAYLIFRNASYDQDDDI